MPIQSHAWHQLGFLLVTTIGIGTFLAVIAVTLSSSRKHQLTAHTAWPRPTTYMRMTVFFLCIAAYGSFVPLNFHWIPWPEAFSRFRALTPLDLNRASRADWGANILLFIPIGYGALGALTLRRSSQFWRVAAFVVVAFVAVAVSVVIEFAQVWLPSRTSSQSDIYAQCIGTLIGGLAWLTVGRELNHWFGSYRTFAQSKSRLEWILQLYALGLLMYSVLPFDLTISLSDLARKVRDGRVALVPFSDFHLSGSYLFGVALDIIVFVPIGALAAIWNQPKPTRARRVTHAIILTGLFALGIETLQLMVLSRFTSATDILVAMVGGGLGAWSVRWLGHTETDITPVSHPQSRTAIWSAFWLAYTVILVVATCYPFDFITHAQELRVRYEQLFRIPLFAFYLNSPGEAVSQVMRNLLAFFPLGVFAACAVGQTHFSAQTRRVAWVFTLLLTAAVALALELVQVALPSRTPDGTDVIVRTAGALLGMIVTCQIFGKHFSRSRRTRKRAADSKP